LADVVDSWKSECGLIAGPKLDYIQPLSSKIVQAPPLSDDRLTKRCSSYWT